MYPSLVVCALMPCLATAVAQDPGILKERFAHVALPGESGEFLPDGWTPWDDFLIGRYELLDSSVLFGGESLEDRTIFVESQEGNVYHVSLMEYADPSWILDQCPQDPPDPACGQAVWDELVVATGVFEAAETFDYQGYDEIFEGRLESVSRVHAGWFTALGETWIITASTHKIHDPNNEEIWHHVFVPMHILPEISPEAMEAARQEAETEGETLLINVDRKFGQGDGVPPFASIWPPLGIGRAGSRETTTKDCMYGLNVCKRQVRRAYKVKMISCGTFVVAVGSSCIACLAFPYPANALCYFVCGVTTYVAVRYCRDSVRWECWHMRKMCYENLDLCCRGIGGCDYAR